jgi:hypothetical protein
MTIENVFTAYQPLLVFSKFLGFFPMSFVGPVRKGNLKFRWINIIPTCFIVLLYTLILFYILTNQFVDINSKILYYGWTLPYFLESLFQLIFALCQIKDANKITFFLRKVQFADEMVKYFESIPILNVLQFLELQANNMGIKSLHGCGKNKTTATLAIMILQACCTVLVPPLIFHLNGVAYGSTKESIVTYGSMILTRNLFIAQFYIASTNIRARFNSLHEHLKANWMKKQFFQDERFGFKFGKLFAGLCDSIDILNSFMTRPFVLYFPLMMNYIIFSAYGLVKQLMQSSPIIPVFMILFCYNLVIHLAFIVFVCWEGSRLTSSAEATIKILGQVMSEHDHTWTQKVDLTFLSSQMRMRNLKAQTFLFTIDWRTFLAVS